MRFHTEYLTFRTSKHREYINITPQVEAALRKSGIAEGMILVSAMHITAGVWVNDAEDGLIADIDEWLEKLAPFRRDYRHHQSDGRIDRPPPPILARFPEGRGFCPAAGLLPGAKR